MYIGEINIETQHYERNALPMVIDLLAAIASLFGIWESLTTNCTNE